MSHLHLSTGAVYNVILFTNLPAIFRESQLPAGCGVDLYFFTFVRFSYDFNASSRGLIEKNPYGNNATILRFPSRYYRFCQLSCETSADRTRNLPLRTQMRENTKLCRPDRLLDLHVYVTGLWKNMQHEWHQNHGPY